MSWEDGFILLYIGVDFLIISLLRQNFDMILVRYYSEKSNLQGGYTFIFELALLYEKIQNFEPLD